ncbi:hypothetical protein SD81_006305 [Tolypothrix campylonemoides VB511288]|nr:hypothetical protein SD81_006305 [Tolypothrix campylonemoides VB511288]
MKKQKSRLSLGFLLLFAGCLVSATPLKVYAGENVVNGTSAESSSFSGDSFNPTNQSESAQPVPGTNVSIEVNGTISVSPEVQQSLNTVATNILEGASSDPTTGTVSTLTNAIATILARGSDASTAINEVQTSLSGSGVSQSLITGLVNNLGGLFTSFETVAVPGVTVAGIQPAQLVVNNQLALSGDPYNVGVTQLDAMIEAYNIGFVNDLAGFLEGFDLASIPNFPIVGLLPIQLVVDVTQLNLAIEAYNNIVLQTDAETFIRLSQNPEFVEISRILQQLRASLRARY